MKKIISTDKAPAAIGPYSQAVEVNGLVFTSGVIPIIPVNWLKAVLKNRRSRQSVI